MKTIQGTDIHYFSPKVGWAHCLLIHYCWLGFLTAFSSVCDWYTAHQWFNWVTIHFVDPTDRIHFWRILRNHPQKQWTEWDEGYRSVDPLNIWHIWSRGYIFNLQSIFYTFKSCMKSLLVPKGKLQKRIYAKTVEAIQIGMIRLQGASEVSCNMTPAWNRYPTSGGNMGEKFDALRASLHPDGIWI